MKPLRLTLDAVGPYPGRHVIDFRTALESRLFGIYGPTGAGKSTLFSAMTFALFGEAAKCEQHVSTLRSDHADATHMTEVELVFETHGRVYRIVRRPEQMRPAKRSGGETREPHKARLFDVTGLDLAGVGEGLPGKVLAEAKVDVVNTQIIELLGYGPAQFRQIVLLPQGRFETFLAANTPDRVKILRELFDVSLYRRLADEVKTRADAAEAKVRTDREVCAGRLAAERFATHDDLTAGITTANADLILHRDAAVAARTALDGATQVYQTAALTDQAFLEHVEADQAFKAVAAEAEAMALLGQRIVRARAAQMLLAHEQSVAVAQQTAAETARLAVTAAEVEQNAKAAAQGAIARLAALTETTPQHEHDKAALLHLAAHAQCLDAAVALQETATKAATTAQADAAQAAASKTVHTERARRLDALTRLIESARADALRRAELLTRQLETSQAQQAAAHYEAAQTQLAADGAALERLDSEAQRASAELSTCQAAFDAAEAALLQNHALHVAAHLAPGEPCPACGSRDHPAPAHGDAQASGVADSYQRARDALESARKRALEARTRAGAAHETFERQRAEVQTLPVPPRAAQMLATELAGLRDALAALGPEVDLAALDAKKAELETAVAAALATSEADEARAQASDMAAALARQSLDAALHAVPVELRDRQKLSNRQQALARKIDAWVAALDGARADERRASDALIEAGSTAAHAAEARTRAEAQRTSAQESFTAQLVEAGLSDFDYRAGKADIPQVASFEARIAEHRDRQIRADERLTKAALAIATVDRPDIVALKDAKEAAEAALSTASDRAASTQARVQHLERLAAELATELARLDRLEQETGPLRELADAFTGRNDLKMELETFAIATMFDHVLDAANLRLGPMSKGRYRLVRETEGRGNARRGLGLMIDDAHTGRPRPASTLSGGETFIAALALALGLSDVVESTRGNIRLDTIFIDEGFGSLDADGDDGTLEQVLEALLDHVGQHRAVGLISHVPLVQQRIPNGFWITKTTAGSSVELRL